MRRKNRREPDAEAVDWQAEAEKFKEFFIRGQADMDNMKKRLEREKSDFLKYATESLLKDLLPVLDNLDRALENVGCGENDTQKPGDFRHDEARRLGEVDRVIGAGSVDGHVIDAARRIDSETVHFTLRLRRSTKKQVFYNMSSK